jgi:hypothetical protein
VTPSGMPSHPGGLVKTNDLIDAVMDGYVAGAGLDVIEEEDGLFYEVRVAHDGVIDGTTRPMVAWHCIQHGLNLRRSARRTTRWRFYGKSPSRGSSPCRMSFLRHTWYAHRPSAAAFALVMVSGDSRTVGSKQRHQSGAVQFSPNHQPPL